ncbi:unnamed protein product [Calypogeia fissa]
MQGMHGGYINKRVAQLPLNAVIWGAQQGLVLPCTTSSIFARGRPLGRGVVTSTGEPPLWLRFWLPNRSRHRESYTSLELTFQIPAATSQQGWKTFRTSAFQTTRLLPATMTTVSVALDEGRSTQLRRRKGSHISMSTTRVVSSVMDSKSKQQNNRKRSAKAAAGSDDDMEPALNKEEGFATELEARLWNLDKTDQLNSLTVVQLRGLMKHISKPTAGRKEELIGEVKKWLTGRQALTNRQTVLDCAPPTRESSSDAESLEGTLLKAESKNRQAQAISRMRESSNGADLQETLVENKVSQQKDSLPRIEDWESMPNGNSVASPRSSRGARQRKKKPEPDAEEDVEPAMVEVNEKKSRARRKVSKVEKQEEETGEEEASVVTTKTSQKRKVQVSKYRLYKKGKVKLDEEELVETKITVSTTEPWTMLVHKKPQPDWIVYNPSTMRPAPSPSGTKTMKLISWNVNGLRALMKDKDKKAQEGLLLTKLAMEEDFDVLCLQETKLQEKDVEQISENLLSDYAHPSWSCSTSKLGYSGTAVISRVEPISVTEGMGIPDHDGEGRLITVEFDTFFLVTSYVPNSGEKLARLSYRTEEWDPALSRYIKELEKQKPVILTGDLNCANEEIDIYNPDGNRKSAGFTAEERASFKAQFLNQGLVDTFRRQHPNAVGYTYWAYRSGARPKNMGWRLDYFLVSESLAEQVHDSYVRPDVLGSDHCPIGIILKL